MFADLRTAFHQLKRQPSFVVGATVSLAIGMSVATAVFSIVEGTLLRPLPVPEPSRLVSVVETVPSMGVDHAFVDPRYVVALREQSQTLQGVAPFSMERVTVGESGEARTTQAARVTATFFQTLRVRPHLGQPFDAARSSVGGRTVIISHALWTARLGQRPDVVGQSIRVRGVSHMIVGVMPAGFSYPFGARLWLQFDQSTIEYEAATGSNPFPMYHVVARLAGGSTLETAAAEVKVIYKRLFGDAAPLARGTRTELFAEFLTRNFRDDLRLWGIAAILILLLCAVNFATLSLARGMRRSAEIAVRVTLGASRSHIVRLLVAEAALVSIVAGAAAVLLGWWMLTYAAALFADSSMPIATELRWPTILFGVLATVAIGFLFAVAPAIELAKVDLRSALSRAATTTTIRSGEMRGRRALVALQLSLALTAAAVVTSIVDADSRFRPGDAGIPYDAVVLASVTAADSSIRELSLDPLLERVRALPGAVIVASVGKSQRVIAWRDDESRHAFGAISKDVSPEFFDAAGLRLLAGRLPSAEEIAGRASVVVATAPSSTDKSFLTRTVGTRMRMKPPGREARWVTIIGIVPSIGSWSLGALASTYYTVAQQPAAIPATLVVRVATKPESFASVLSRALVSFDAAIRVADTQTAAQLVAAERRGWLGRTVFLIGVAAIAMLLALAGVYGLTSYSMELRARELAIRTALGARAPQLISVVFAEMWWMSAVAVLIAMVASGRLTAFLDGIFRNPMVNVPLITLAPAPTAVATLALLTILAAGSTIPLRRVLRLDVMRTIQGSQ